MHKNQAEKDKIVGVLGEAFVYEALKNLLPGLDDSVWQSENRNKYLGDEIGADGHGYDFSVSDVDGRLLERGAGKRCLIEVKATSLGEPGPFQMTQNEWSRAIEAHHSSGEEYLVYRVVNADSEPTIADVIQDPFGLMQEGKLALSESGFWVYVGKPN